MTLSFWQQISRAPEVTCDVAIVGGGVVGCATAYWLRRIRPRLSVVLVEAGHLASGASGRNAGFLTPGTTRDYFSDLDVHGPDRTRRLWQFTKENREMLFAELRGRSFDLEASGSLLVAGDAEEDLRLQSSVSRMRADGFPVAYIPPREANRRMMGQGFGGALYVPAGAMLNPVLLVRHLAEESGVHVLEQHPVLGLSGTRGRLVLETPTRHIRAAQTVFALNAFLPGLFPELRRFVRPVRGQMMALGPMQPRWLHVPASTHNGYFYLRQTPDGVVLLGGARHHHADAEVGYIDATTEAVQSDLEAYLHRHFPHTADLAVRHRWSGVMGFSPDKLPVIGAVPEVPGSFWATGFSGHGNAYAFRIGQLLAELTLGYARPEGLDLFSEERFAPATA